MKKFGKSKSPLRLFLKRFLRHRAAVFGLVMMLIPMLFVASSFFYDGFVEPDTMRPWLGARPPLSAVPFCLSENSFSVGSEVPKFFNKCSKTIEFAVRNREVVEYRVVLRHGKIKRIWQMGKNSPLKTVKFLPEGAVRFEQIFLNQESVALTKDLTLNEGEELPACLTAVNRVVIIRETKFDQVPSVYKIVVKDGFVASILKNDKPIKDALITGESVASVKVDGILKRIWFVLGTDMAGRDMLSRVIYGGRISLMIGFVATLVSLVIGVVYGAVSGYVGGKTDRVMMGTVDIMYAIPFMFLVIILMVNFGRNLFVLFAALGAVQWLTMSRIVRGTIRSLKYSEFVEAARMSGSSPFKIIFHHLLPNCLAPIIVYTTLTVPAVILEESFLSFIGLSVQYDGRTLDSWGALVSHGVQAVSSDGGRLWVLLVPATAMVMTLLGLNCLGDGLRDLLDPKQKK